MSFREEIELVADDQRAVLDEVGGGIRSYRARGRDLLDGYPAGQPSPSGRGQVLIPWPNRLEDGSYEFDGQRHQLELNEPENGNAIHGLVRWEPWTVAERDSQRVVMEHELSGQPGYPYTVRLLIEYVLALDGLTVHTQATNVGESACPFGGGFHPYFTLGTETVDSVILHVPAATVVGADERGLPLEAAPVEGTEYDFRRPKPIGSTRFDHAFTDLVRDSDDLARVALGGSHPGQGLEVWVDESYGYLQVFSGDPLPDVNRRSLAVEPMTCPANAFRTGDGLIRLEPGESFTGAWGISLS
ncbi:MAG: aldose 1-epimerase family protein [Gaiellaceae bacterium]